MRHKVYTKEQIIKAARELVIESGFEHFTARNIAKKMGGSTQPIYMHFKSMKELKLTLMDSLQQEIGVDPSPVVQNEQELVADLNGYIAFGQKNPQLFKALFFDESGLGELVYQQSLAYCNGSDSQEETNKEPFPADQAKRHHDYLWSVATGITLLTNYGLIELTDDAQQKLLNQFLNVLRLSE